VGVIEYFLVKHPERIIAKTEIVKRVFIDIKLKYS
jgi:hypothetical protein